MAYSYELVNISVDDHYIGATSVSNPVLYMFVDGVFVSGNYIVQNIGASYRYIYPRVISGAVYITDFSFVFGSELPAFSKSITVLVGEIT